MPRLTHHAHTYIVAFTLSYEVGCVKGITANQSDVTNSKFPARCDRSKLASTSNS